MRSSIPLGRIAGIRIGASWTVLLIAALYTASLAQVNFPDAVPGLADSAYWLAGAVTAVLFFASLLAHELGHAFVARREGVGVSGIDLWLLGGMARLESTAPSAKAEIRISVIGPLTSGAVGLVALALSTVIGGSDSSQLAAEVLRWLGFINLVLAAFNLLPGLPLDGGRVLAGILWWRSGDEVNANATAAQIGRVLGGSMTIIGGYLFLGRAQEGGLWLALVGVYIWSASSQELKRAPIMYAVHGVRVGDVMRPAPSVAPDWVTVEQFLGDLDRTTTQESFPVRSWDGRLTGVITANAVQASDPASWPHLKVADLAFPVDRLVTAGPTDQLLATVQRLEGTAVGDAFVVDEKGSVVGVVGMAEVSRLVDQRWHQPTST